MDSSTVVDDHAVAFAGLVEAALGSDALGNQQQVSQQHLVALLRGADACHQNADGDQLVIMGIRTLQILPRPHEYSSVTTFNHSVSQKIIEMKDCSSILTRNDFAWDD